MLSCVWQGVCSAFTDMPWPILNVSPSFGVLLTASHCLPPITGSPLNCESCYVMSKATFFPSAQTDHLLVATCVVPMACWTRQRGIIQTSRRVLTGGC